MWKLTNIYIARVGFANNIEDILGACNIPSYNPFVFLCFAVDLIILDLKIS
jgi:hypothetical protein